VKKGYGEALSRILGKGLAAARTLHQNISSDADERRSPLALDASRNTPHRLLQPVRGIRRIADHQA
jgi:hypothetical protein